jgi:hypothetical protein
MRRSCLERERMSKAVREVLTIAKYRWRGVRNDLVRSSGQRAVAAFVFALNLFGALFAYRGFVKLLEGRSSLGNDALFARSILLLLGILELAYLLSLVSAAKEFLGSPQIPLLLVAPVKPSSLLWSKYFAVLADRNLEITVIVLGTPCLMAMHRAGLAHALYLFPPFFASALLVNMVAVATVLLVARYVWQWRKVALGIGAGLPILLLAWVVLAAGSEPVGFTSEAVLSFLQGWHTEFASRPFLMTVALTLALLLILWGLAWFLSRIYAPAWSKLQETRLVKPGLAKGPKRQVSGFVHRILSPWQGATRAILLKDWRTMARSPLFPVRVLGLLLTWAMFSVIKERLAVQNPLAAGPLVVAYVLLCLQATVIEPTANAFAGEGNRLSLILTAPLSSGQLIRAKLVAQLIPALLASAVSTFVVGFLVPLPWPMIGLAALLACFVTATNATLLVGGSVIATDLSIGVSGVLEEILFEETMVSPIAAYRMALAGFSLVFQAANVALLAVPYWWGRGGGSLSSVFWAGLAGAFLALNGATALGAWRVGAAGLNRLTK